MALDTETKRASLMPSMLPFPATPLSQVEQQGLIPFMFADPLAIESVLWTEQPDQSPNWTGKADSSTIWTGQTDQSTVWS